jgi:hypothetical protein
MTKLGFIAATVIFSSLLAMHDANAAGGCGAGLYRDPNGLCQFYRSGPPPNQDCGVGYIWRNGRCRQNVQNDPFVSTWPNAPR